MITLNDAVKHEISRWEMFANTPRFLVKHLRAVEGLVQIADTTPVQGLVENFNEAVKSDPQDVLQAHAMLIALSHKPEFREAIANLQASTIFWGPEIIAALVADDRPTTVIAIPPMKAPAITVTVQDIK